MLEERTVYWAECDECGDCTPEFDTEFELLRWVAANDWEVGGAHPLPRMPPRFSHMLSVRARAGRTAASFHRIRPPSR